MENVSRDKSKRKLRRSIKVVIGNIEAIMTDIHYLLEMMGLLVQQIDRTAERIESKYKRGRTVSDSCQSKCQKPSILPLKSLTRESACLVMDNTYSRERIYSPFKEDSNSKQKIPTPSMDYTYLELMNGYEICDEHCGHFTYNANYPLWMQFDSWRPGYTTCTSDSSFVSGGSDGKTTTCKSNHSGWSSPQSAANKLKNNYRQIARSENGIRFDACCKCEEIQLDQYCGVYEQIMDELLENECLSLSSSGHKYTENKRDTNSSVCLSLSDENVFRYKNTPNPWTAYCTNNAYIETSCSTCS